MTRIFFFGILAILSLLAGCCHPSHSVCTPPAPEALPKSEIVLFDGTGFSHWIAEKGGDIRWEIEDGDTMKVVPGSGSIMTRQMYRDFSLHVEFMVPVLPPIEQGKSRGNRGNSGIYLQRRYEVQILDSFGVKLENWDCGALYRAKAPDVNVSKKSGEWQSFDITFRSPRYSGEGDSRKKVENARITVLHNNAVIHNNVELTNKTGVGKPEGPEPGPILLQDHGNEVRFRNIRIVPVQSKQRAVQHASPIH